MLKQIIESAGLRPETCAKLLGVDSSIFQEWITGQRPVAPFMIPHLSSVLGVSAETILGPRVRSGDSADITPAIWFKLRSGELSDADKESIVLIRRLGFYLNQLESATGRVSIAWKGLFTSIVQGIDKQAPPREQGRAAARIFRGSAGLSHGATGIGDLIRGSIRRTGLLVIESPIPGSRLEGCAFYVGPPGAETPCIFVNSYESTWFRRNMIIAHELGHTIFDIASDAVSLDYLSGGGASGQNDEFRENRAQGFAQELLAPMEVIHHVSQTNGFHWDNLDSGNVALLVAKTQVEKKTVLAAAEQAGFITREQAETYAQLDISHVLPSLTERALSTEEYKRKVGIDRAASFSAGRRTTTLSGRALRLPVPYVVRVIEAVQSNDVSVGKAAEMMMIERETFMERFGDIVGVAQ